MLHFFNNVLSNSDRFPVSEELLFTVSALPVSTASCQDFQNDFKNKFRSTVRAVSLNDLMSN